jgi:hypothetical protein
VWVLQKKSNKNSLGLFSGAFGPYGLWGCQQHPSEKKLKNCMVQICSEWMAILSPSSKKTNKIKQGMTTIK